MTHVIRDFCTFLLNLLLLLVQLTAFDFLVIYKHTFYIVSEVYVRRNNHLTNVSGKQEEMHGKSGEKSLKASAICVRFALKKKTPYLSFNGSFAFAADHVRLKGRKRNTFLLSTRKINRCKRRDSIFSRHCLMPYLVGNPDRMDRNQST